MDCMSSFELLGYSSGVNTPIPRVKIVDLEPMALASFCSGVNTPIPKVKIIKMINSWKQRQSPVGRVALIPTSVYITNKFYRSMEMLYANVFCLYGLFLYACFCRDKGNPTYGVAKDKKHDNLTYFSHELFFNVKIIKKP